MRKQSIFRMLMAVVAIALTSVFALTSNAQQVMTTKGIGTVKLNSAGKALPKTMAGLYTKLTYQSFENEMEGYTERTYTGTLNGKETVKFEIDDNGKVSRIEVYRGANVAIQTAAGKMNLSSVTAQGLLNKGGEAWTNGYFYSGFFIKYKGVFFSYGEGSLTPAGKRKVAANEGAESFKLKSSDVQQTAKPKSVSVSIY